MKKEVEILEKLQLKINEVNNFETKGDTQLELYKEGLLTAYAESKSILVSTFREYCRFEDCDEELHWL